MNDIADQDLLRAYSGDRSEAAFAELVRRHIDFVYSAALRMVGDRQLAEDVTQAVFAAVAQNARELTGHPVLSGWLHRTAQNLAANVVRSNVRRRAREQEAAAMKELLSPEPDSLWEQIAPQLDVALSELNPADRDALLLRYFQHKSAREMAQILGTNEEAAQKRVHRAVERLRELFARRGITTGIDGLTIAISGHAVHAAPAGISSAVSLAARLAAPGLTTTTKAIAMTTLPKTLVTLTLFIAIGTGIYEARQAANLSDRNMALQREQSILAGRISELSNERDSLAGQLAQRRDATEIPNTNSAELLRLRAEVTRLRAAAQASTQPAVADTNDLITPMARAWINRANQLKQYVNDNPKEQIPEFRFLTQREWLAVADAGLSTQTFENPDDYRRAMESLRFQAQSRFANLVSAALEKFSVANNGQFPTELSQLQPLITEPGVAGLLDQLYEIRPSESLPEELKQFKSERGFITRKVRVNQNSTSRLAIFRNGNGYWQSPP